MVVQSGAIKGRSIQDLRRMISRAVKATTEKYTTNRRDEWLQLKSRVGLEAEKKQQQQRSEQGRPWTLAGTQESGPGFRGEREPRNPDQVLRGGAITIRVGEVDSCNIFVNCCLNLLHPLCKRTFGTALCSQAAGEWLAA